MSKTLETLSDAIATLKEHANVYEFIATDQFGNFHYRLQNSTEPELEDVYFMALHKDNGIGEDGQTIEGRDYEVIEVRILETRIGKTKEGVLACFCKVEPVKDLPSWYVEDTDETDRMLDFESVNISLLADNEYWLPTQDFKLKADSQM